MADVETPSGVEEILESTRLQSQETTTVPHPEVSNIPRSTLSSSEVDDHSRSTDQSVQLTPSVGARRTQTPAELSAALSAAVDNLDLTRSEHEANIEPSDLDYSAFSQPISSPTKSDSSAFASPPAQTNSASAKPEPPAASVVPSLATGGSVSSGGGSQSSKRDSQSSRSSSQSGSQGKGPFICSVCSFQCRSKSGLASHMRTHKTK